MDGVGSTKPRSRLKRGVSVYGEDGREVVYKWKGSSLYIFMCIHINPYDVDEF